MQWKLIWLITMRLRVQSLTLLSGLGIWLELWFNPSLGTPICLGGSPRTPQELYFYVFILFMVYHMFLKYLIIMQKCRNWDSNALGDLPEWPQQAKLGLEYGWWSNGKAHAVSTIIPSSHHFTLQIMISFYTNTVKTIIGLFIKYSLV